MSTTHFSGPVDSKSGFKINNKPLVEVAGSTATSKRIVCGAASVKNGDTISTGLTSVDSFQLTASVAGHVVTGTVIGGTITVKLQDNAGSAVTTAEIVYWLAIGS